MNRAYIERCIHTLDGMIATFEQAVVIGGRTLAESQVCELLKEARLKLVEELEEEDDGFERRMASQVAQFEEDKSYYSSLGLHADE